MAFQKSKGMTIAMPADGDAKKANDLLRPYWFEWAKDNGPEYEKALALVLKAIGK